MKQGKLTAGQLAVPQALELGRRRPQLAPRIGAGEGHHAVLGLGLLDDRADDERLSSRAQLAAQLLIGGARSASPATRRVSDRPAARCGSSRRPSMSRSP